jgi:hypothetical protein
VTTGSSIIRGRVIAEDTGRPLRRAVVRLTAPTVREQRTATTDQDGRFEFTQLPAAGYLVLASKTGYVPMGFKQTRPNSVQQPLVLGDRQTADHVDITLPPGGVISGRVVDEYGEPVAEASVAASRLQFVNGARRPIPAAAPSTSNDIGEFRLYGLAPGDYYVGVTPRSGSNPTEVNVDTVGYGPTYYPSASDVGSAQRIAVRAGEQITNIVVSLTPSRTARVSGIVLDADGRAARGGNVSVLSRTGIGMPASNAFVRPDGSFVVGGLAAGDYTLRAFVGAPSPGPTQVTTFASANITVNGADIANLVLRPQSPISLTGRLTGDPAALAALQPRTSRLIAAPFGLSSVPAGPIPPPQPLGDDLSFQLFAYPGTVIIRPASLNGLLIRSVRSNGRDVTYGLEVAPGLPLADIEVEVVASTSRIAATVTNLRGEAVVGRDVLVFSEDEAAWPATLAGHASQGRTNQEGLFQTSPLLPGRYYVAAIENLEPGQNADPEFLASLRAAATRVILGQGETHAVTLVER